MPVSTGHGTIVPYFVPDMCRRPRSLIIAAGYLEALQATSSAELRAFGSSHTYALA
jgi:hypothetical protein